MAALFMTSFLVAAAAALPQADDGAESVPQHPNFTLPTVDGGSGSMADHLGGKLVVIHFASW